MTELPYFVCMPFGAVVWHDGVLVLQMPRYDKDNRGMLYAVYSLKTLSMFRGMSFIDL